MKDKLDKWIDSKNLLKIKRINNTFLENFLFESLNLLNPSEVFVSEDTVEDIEFIKKQALAKGEEQQLKIKSHTVHFDNYKDQARDKANTVILLENQTSLSDTIKAGNRNKLLCEIRNIMNNIMKNKTLYILFFSLGPANSPFTIPALQLTDSAYVAHSECLLYRKGYNEFLKRGNSNDFFKFIHSAGELDENNTSKNLDKRRIYIDIKSNTVYSANTQYGGNSIGLKKLAMRLAINKATKEGWLTEHMLIMGINLSSGKKVYVTGAFPSLCGKTSTAMLSGESIIGDDIAYIRNINGYPKAVNVEKGMFGIIQGINSKDDPIQWEALNSDNEIIFSNVLITEDKSVHWIGKDGKVPPTGYNHSGKWWNGKKDENGILIPCSHPNARFTLSLEILKNLDSEFHNPEGVTVSAIVYGGRDSNTSPPVEEAFDYEHGIITKGASLVSETTAATLGKVGIRKFNPMSNLDFLSVPLPEYIKNNLNFFKNLKYKPKFFSVNYFLKDEKGNFLNEKNDKKVWYKWMALRITEKVNAIETCCGKIPLYEDLKALFEKVLGKKYTKEDYIKQFSLRVPENIDKIDFILEIYKKIPDTPEILFKVLNNQKSKLQTLLKKYGKLISPFAFC